LKIRNKVLENFFLNGQAYMLWNIVKNGQRELGSNWEKFVEILREKFYPSVIKTQKEDEFLKLE